jgi:hypothetical protein
MRFRKRGNSLERDVSLLILQTAAGGAESAHFLVTPEATAPIKSAEDILSDLFVSQDTSLEIFSLDEGDGNAEFPNAFFVEASMEPEATTVPSTSITEPSPSPPEEEDTSIPPGLTRNYVLESKKETTGDSSVISKTFTDDSLFAFSEVFQEPPKSGNEALYPEDAQDPIQSKWTPNDAFEETGPTSKKEAEGSTPEANSVSTSLTLEENSVSTVKAVFATGNKPSSPGRSPNRSPNRSSDRSRWMPNDAPKETNPTSTKEAEGSTLEANSVLTSLTLEANSVLRDKAVFATGNKPSSRGRSLHRSPNRSPDRARSRVSASDGASEVQFALSFVSSSTAEEGVLSMALSTCLTIDKADTSIDKAWRSSTPDTEEDLSGVKREEIFLDRLVNIVATAQKERPANVDISHYFESDDDNESNCTEDNETFSRQSGAETPTSSSSIARVPQETAEPEVPDPDMDDFIKARAFGDSDDDGESAQEAEWTAFDTSPFTNLDNMTEASGSTAPEPHGDKPSPDSPTSITDFSKRSDFSTSSSIRKAANAIWWGYDTSTDDLASI